MSKPVTYPVVEVRFRLVLLVDVPLEFPSTNCASTPPSTASMSKPVTYPVVEVRFRLVLLVDVPLECHGRPEDLRRIANQTKIGITSCWGADR
jgi:hypothetical protein